MTPSTVGVRWGCWLSQREAFPRHRPRRWQTSGRAVMWWRRGPAGWYAGLLIWLGNSNGPYGWIPLRGRPGFLWPWGCEFDVCTWSNLKKHTPNGPLLWYLLWPPEPSWKKKLMTNPAYSPGDPLTLVTEHPKVGGGGGWSPLSPTFCHTLPGIVRVHCSLGVANRGVHQPYPLSHTTPIYNYSRTSRDSNASISVSTLSKAIHGYRLPTCMSESLNLSCPILPAIIACGMYHLEYHDYLALVWTQTLSFSFYWGRGKARARAYCS